MKVRRQPHHTFKWALGSQRTFIEGGELTALLWLSGNTNLPVLLSHRLKHTCFKQAKDRVHRHGRAHIYFLSFFRRTDAQTTCRFTSWFTLGNRRAPSPALCVDHSPLDVHMKECSNATQKKVHCEPMLPLHSTCPFSTGTLASVGGFAMQPFLKVQFLNWWNTTQEPLLPHTKHKQQGEEKEKKKTHTHTHKNAYS